LKKKLKEDLDKRIYFWQSARSTMVCSSIQMKRYLIQLIQEKGIIFTINEVAADEMSKNLFILLNHDMEACE